MPLRQRADIGEINLDRPSEEEIESTADRTRSALEKIALGQISASKPKNVRKQTISEPTYIRYTPANQMGERGDKIHSQRIIKMVDRVEDPMEPAKFKHRKLPRGPGSPPPPIMHSPPRKVTAKEQSEWNIPPSISNWKNPKGYTIPLDKRMAAKGSHLSEVKINDNFAKFSEALFAADRAAREEVAARSRIQAQLAAKEREEKEQSLRALAEKARKERYCLVLFMLMVDWREAEEDDRLMRNLQNQNQSQSQNPKIRMSKQEPKNEKNSVKNEQGKQEENYD